MILLFINIGLLFPDRIQLKEYRVTALIPLPAMRPEPEPIKVKPVIKAKLLPPAPIFEQPRLIVLPRAREPGRDELREARSISVVRIWEPGATALPLSLASLCAALAPASSLGARLTR